MRDENTGPEAQAGHPESVDADPNKPDDYADAAIGAFSDNTERALRSDLGIFEEWCRSHGFTPLPAAPEIVAAFVDHMAMRRAPATVRRYVASIVIAHRTVARDGGSGDAVVKLALKRMHRAQGRRQRQAEGLTWPILQRLLAAAGNRLIDTRNKALVTVAYDAMLRRSELTALDVVDLLDDSDGSGTLVLCRSKTDDEGCGATPYLAPDTMGYVRGWKSQSRITEGRLFRSVSKGGALGNGLHASQIPRIFKGMAARAGMPAESVERLSGHSPRVGAAQDMVAAGIELPAILQAGRWSTPAMVSRYGERLLARRGGAAQLARLQQRA